MDVRGKLAPITQRTRTIVAVKALETEDRLLSLPRPLREMKTTTLTNLLERGVGAIFMNAIVLKTGKALIFSVKNRELNKFGHGAAIFGLIWSIGLVTLSAHEYWARKRRPDDFEYLVSKLRRSAASRLAAEQAQNERDLINKP